MLLNKEGSNNTERCLGGRCQAINNIDQPAARDPIRRTWLIWQLSSAPPNASSSSLISVYERWHSCVADQWQLSPCLNLRDAQVRASCRYRDLAKPRWRRQVSLVLFANRLIRSVYPCSPVLVFDWEAPAHKTVTEEVTRNPAAFCNYFCSELSQTQSQLT